MIVDAFMFFNELDLLEIRLNELSSVVDRFVLVESRQTFSFKPKPLHFQENRERFRPFLDRIQHIVIDRFDSQSSSWSAEKQQRDCLASALDSCSDDDIFVYSDMDEIPNHAVFGPEIAKDGPVSLEQPNYYCFLNTLCTSEPVLRKTKVLRKRHLNTSLSVLRELQHPAIPKGGWHFSYLGGAPKIQTKMNAYSHQELNRSFFTSEANFARALRAGRLHIDVRKHISRVELDESFPRYVLENREKLAHLIAPPGSIGGDPWALLVMSGLHSIARAKMRLENAPRKFTAIAERLLGTAKPDKHS